MLCEWFKLLIFGGFVNCQIECRMDQLAIDAIQLLSDFDCHWVDDTHRIETDRQYVERSVELSLVVEKGRILHE